MDATPNGGPTHIGTSMAGWEIREVAIEVGAFGDPDLPKMVRMPDSWEPFAVHRERHWVIVSLRRRRPVDELLP